MEEALIKRILPHSIEAEQSVIGSMILDRDAILVASEILTSETGRRSLEKQWICWNCQSTDSAAKADHCR